MFLWVQTENQNVLTIGLSSDTSFIQDINCETLRTSPIYQVGGPVRECLPKSGKILLLFPVSARQLIHQLKRIQPPQTTMYVSHGLSSVLLIVDDQSDIETYYPEFIHLVSAIEIWPFVENQVILSRITTEILETNPAEITGLKWISIHGLPDLVVDQIEQFIQNISLLWDRARYFCPEFGGLVSWLHKQVAETTDVIRKAAFDKASPTAVSDYQVNLTSLIEVNESLSTLTSQLLGIVPGVLASSFFPIGKYSLLGIGTVVRSMWRFYSHINDVFASEAHLSGFESLSLRTEPFDFDEYPSITDMESWNNPVIRLNSYVREPTASTIVEADGSWRVSFNPSLQEDDEIVVTLINEKGETIDRSLQLVPVDLPPYITQINKTLAYGSGLTPGLQIDIEVNPVEAREHIVYFSARLGFHQTLNTISSSWQCIQWACTMEWSPITFTHEYLHSYVREFLEAILFPDDASELAITIRQFNSGMRDTWLDKTRALFIRSFWRMASADELLDKKQGDLPRKPPRVVGWSTISEAQLRYWIENYRKLLEEFIVHTLDFVYFYDGNDELFIKSIWRSWATVPTVPLSLQTYVLRTLVALSSTANTLLKSDDLFLDASRRLNSELIRVRDEDGDETGVLQRAIDLLADGSDDSRRPDSRTDLFTRFVASFRIGRFTKEVLVSESIHAKIVRDRRSIYSGLGAGHSYRIDFGDYPDLPIESPVGFILDRLRKAVPVSLGDAEEKSLWQFLAMT